MYCLPHQHKKAYRSLIRLFFLVGIYNWPIFFTVSSTRQYYDFESDNFWFLIELTRQNWWLSYRRRGFSNFFVSLNFQWDQIDIFELLATVGKILIRPHVVKITSSKSHERFILTIIADWTKLRKPLARIIAAWIIFYNWQE